MSCENNAKTSSEIEHVEFWSTGTGSGHNCANVRFGSGSSQASQSSGDICRICHCESDPHNPLLTPCYCSGSLKYVHQSCLQQWLTASDTNSCELCKFPFIMHTKIKPFNEWRSLDISGIERRRLCCSVLFHCAAALCVIWSLCVLIERAADDVQRGQIDWPFWTKLAVVTVGLTGGIVFMYIQCKAYLHLCHRWKARNRILLIQNAPEKVQHLSPPSPISTKIARGKRVSGAVANAVSGSVEINASSNAPNLSNFSAAIGGNGGHVDVVSQISSFRPCPQGSGSMTPFHDSIHNVLENSESSSRGSVNDLCVGSRQDLSTGGISTDTGREHALQLSSFSGSGEHKAPSISSGVSNAVANGLGGFTYRPQTTAKRYSNSSIFLENRDILNDSVVLGSDSSNVYEYGVQPKLEYRHSSMLTPTQVVGDAASHDIMRRYSDTKLHGGDCEATAANAADNAPVFYKVASNHDKAGDTGDKHMRQLLLVKPNRETVLDMELPTSPLSPPPTYGISCRSQQTQTLRRSFDTVDMFGSSSGSGNGNDNANGNGNGTSSNGRGSRQKVNVPSTSSAAEAQINRPRLVFKSLPNLNSSVENLIRN